MPLASTLRPLNALPDQVDRCALWEEAKKYYANILWPLGGLISRKIDELTKMNLEVSMIAPSHGMIWREDPMQIVRQYAAWAKQETSPSAVIVFDTMWRSTEKMARKIADGISCSGVPVKIYNIAESDQTVVIADMLQARGFLFGSSTHDNDMLPGLAGFLELIKGFKPKNRRAAAFGSYGWAGGAVEEIEDALKKSGIEVSMPSISCRFVPDKTEHEKLFFFRKEFRRIA